MVLEKLRRSTKPLHDRLEQRLDILRSPFDSMRYLRILQRFYGFYKPLESCLPAYQDCSDRWLDADRRKIPLLREDLYRASLSDSDISALPICDDLPVVSDADHQMGCMYVLEGATLGGQAVLRNLSTANKPAETGVCFFTSYGNLVGQRWREFCARLEAFSSSHGCDAVVNSACETFATLDRWLFADGGL